MKKIVKKHSSDASSIADVLQAIGPRPPDDAEQGTIRKYAQAFSNALARKIADLLRPVFPEIFPDAQGRLKESRAPIARGFKRLDVNYSTTQLGLALGISIKTISHRDRKGKGRYSHNYPRVDDELRAEAMDYHVRQPYAIMLHSISCRSTRAMMPSVRRLRRSAHSSGNSAFVTVAKVPTILQNCLNESSLGFMSLWETQWAQFVSLMGNSIRRELAARSHCITQP